MELNKLLQKVIDKKASDLHLTVGQPPVLRIDGALNFLQEEKIIAADLDTIVLGLLSPEQKEFLTLNKEIDFSFDFEGKGRFRVNIFTEMGQLAVALRLIPIKIPTIEELQLPEILYDFGK